MTEAKKLLLGIFRSKSRVGQHDPAIPKSEEKSEEEHLVVLAPTAEDDVRIQGNNTLSLAATDWPPRGFTSESELSEQQAKSSITIGAPIFNGHSFSILHASEDYFALYATSEGVSAGDDCTTFYQPAFLAMTFRKFGLGVARKPWESLEQPSLAFCYGKFPGTITLNHWTSMSGRLKPTVALKDPGIRPREIELPTIIDRLIYLETGFEEDDEDLMYRNLYKVLLKDPDRFLSPHKAMEKQIADLIVVLSGPQWIDFSDSRNHVVAKYFAGVAYAEEARYNKFFHQLLLSVELDIRINSKYHAEIPKQKLLCQLPPCIAWDLALSKKWRECISIRRVKTPDGPEQIKFQLRFKKRQVKALRKFARAMKWPNFISVDNFIRSKDREGRKLESRTSDTMSYFSGVILPGPTLPFLLMNTLLDCDQESKLGALTHIYPQCGFQYRSTTYWSSTSIVGKVLAPHCREIAGWIGPAISAPDLDRTQVVNIRQRRPRQNIDSNEVKSMMERSDPLGPPPSSQIYPVKEYQLVLPDFEEIDSNVRVEKLALEPVSTERRSQGTSPIDALLYDACIQFAVNGTSWPLYLSFDVSYICAHPCAGGPHPLFYDYIYKAVKVDEILTIRNWGSLYNLADPDLGVRDSSEQISYGQEQENDKEKVLVVEAFGVPDHEVLARAWASHWGLSAIVAVIAKTCMACAIREAYAACLNVVILIEDIRLSDT